MLGRSVKILVSLLIFVVLSTIVVSAQESELTYLKGHTVEIKIYFPYDESHIDLAYMDNLHNLHLADSLLKYRSYIATLSKIEILAQSSPEGSVEHNERLSQRRRLSIESYFRTNYPDINPSLWSFKAVAENWDLFHQHLVEDLNVPNRAEVLSISGGSRDSDDKEWLLKKLDDGRPWLYIKEHILPMQRFGASLLFIPIAETPILYSDVEIGSRLTIPMLEAPQLPRYDIVQEEATQKVLFALKTNLLLDVVTVVNIAAEIPIGKRWSVVGEVVYPWWRSWPDNFTMQIESYHGELKYWLGDRDSKSQLHGWSVGLYGGWGIYDIQLFSEEGVQGEFYDAGAQLCYSHPIANNLHLEYTLGLGYVSTDYNDYNMVYDTEEFGDIKVIPYPWMNSKLSSVLPTRLGVSLVWHITTKSKGGAK